MIVLDCGGAWFSAAMHDAAISKLGRSTGLYLRSNRAHASHLKEVWQHIESPVSYVLDDRCKPSVIELRDAENGELMVQIKNFHLGSFGEN